VAKKPVTSRRSADGGGARAHPVDPVIGPLAEGAHPEVAEALRSQSKAILQDWEKQVRRVIPATDSLSFDQFLDHLPEILAAMADALASGNPDEVKRLLERSPSQGIHRFQLHYDVTDLATEDRMLRRLILEHVESALGRTTGHDENLALNWAIDLMAQQAMVAFVNHQNARLREAAEAELKYLSFLSHDLSGNLGSVTLWLQVLKRKLSDAGEFASEVTALDTAQQAILDTMGGMGRLLQAERLRHRGVQPTVGPVNLHALSTELCRQSQQQAEQKGVGMEVHVPHDAVVHSDADLIRLVLQNLIGNAVKYSTRGTVRISAEQGEDGRRRAWVLAVSDEGPGIAPENVERIFEAFRRGEMHGQSGVGLGLAIASRAARLLNAELTVESRPGVGSTFRLVFPPPASPPAAARRPHRE
jgi:signal transduction histidine kinase